MKLKILSLNCQKNYNNNLQPFLNSILKNNLYDIYLLQEATNEVLKLFMDNQEYEIINSKDKYGRLSLPCIVFNSKKFQFKKFEYMPILVDNLERLELKKKFQSFGILRVELKYNDLNLLIGSVHLPSGFSSKRRIEEIDNLKGFMGDSLKYDLTIFGGDCNFCFPNEIKKVNKILDSKYFCLTSKIGATLDSYYTESNIKYSWARINNILRKIGISIKLKTDHIFVDKNSLEKYEFNIEILKDRVSDHSPVELIIENKN